MAKYSIILILLTVACELCAQVPAREYHIQVIKSHEQFSVSQAEQVLKDRNGFLWLLSPSQLQRFDGKNVKTFSFNDRCVSIEQDADGRIWMMGRSSLHCFKNDRAGFEDVTGTVTTDNRFRRMLNGPQDKLYLLTNSGIRRWSPVTKRFEPFGIRDFNYTGDFPFLKSYGPYLFYAHANALCRYNVETGQEDSIACSTPNYLFPVSEDSVWVRQGIGSTALVSFTKKLVSPLNAEQFGERYNDNRFFITGGFRIAPGRYFTVVLHKGYFLYDAAQNNFIKINLYYKGAPVEESTSVWAFYLDKDSIAWMPHQDGIAYFKPFKPVFGLLHSNLSSSSKEWNNEIRHLAEDKEGNIWFGTANGFGRWELNTRRVKMWLPGHGDTQDYLNYESVRSIGFDEKGGKIIVGQSEKGFWIVDPVSGKFTRPVFGSIPGRDSLSRQFYSDFNLNMVRLRNGDFLALSRKAWLIEKGSYHISEINTGLPPGDKRKALQDEQGRVWITGLRGIEVLDSNFRPLHSYPHPTLGRFLNAIVQVDTNTFWVAAKTLFELSIRHDSITLKAIFPELNHEHFCNLFKDKRGHIWMHSNAALYRYQAHQHSLEKFDASDNVYGAPLIAGNELRSSSDVMYITTLNGINYFIPENIPFQNDILQVQLLNVTVNHDDTTFTLKGRFPDLGYSQNSLVFEFIAPWLPNAGKVQYRYYLEGADNDWVMIGNSSMVRFLSLKPGSYRFRLAASLNGKDWYESAETFSFRILPPLWMRWWFWTLLAAVAGVILYKWIQTLRRRIRSEKILNTYATSLYGYSSVEDIFWVTARSCVELLGFSDCVVYQKEEAGNVMVQKAAYGPKNPYGREILNPIKIPIGKGIVGTVAQTGKAERIANTSKDPRYIVDDEVRLSEMAVPVFIEGKVFGVIDSEHARKRFYSRHHLSLLQQMAAICSERIFKYLTEEKLRSHIARDLHDEMGSTLTSINIISKVAMQKDREKTQQYLQKIKDNSGRMLESMSDMVWVVNPANDSFEKVVLRMKEFAAELLEPAGIQYFFEEKGFADDPLQIGITQRKNIYLIFKEAVTNVAKYSHASQLKIKLCKQNGDLLVMIGDNGKGFAFTGEYSGNGIKNMHSRAAEMNATLQIQSEPGKGTQILLATPIT